MKTLILGYTLTDCYRANADFNGQQKQFVLKIDDELTNVSLGGYVNRPSDQDRGQEFVKIAEISEQSYQELKDISTCKKYKHIDFSHLGKYIYFQNLPARQAKKALNIYEQAYIDVYKICSPYNDKANKAKLKAIKKVLKPYLSSTEYKQLDKHIYLF